MRYGFNYRTISVSTSPVQLLTHSANAVQVIQKDSSTNCDELLKRNVVDAITEMDIDMKINSGMEKNQRINCSTVALQTEFGLF